MSRRHLLMCLLGLAACQPYSLQELRNIEPTGTEFQQALAKEYLLLSSQEEQNYDWEDSWHFADKGLAAAYGNDVGPELIADRDIPTEKKAALEKARDDLLTALRPDVVAAQPVLAARAYRYFDCWVEREEEAWQLAKIAECQQGFTEALAGLQAVYTSAGEGGADTTAYIVFFEWNRAGLSKSGEKVVAEVADSLVDQGDYEVVLNGHTDTTGLENIT
jgi:OmpA-OmpF porin, OOP family